MKRTLGKINSLDHEKRISSYFLLIGIDYNRNFFLTNWWFTVLNTFELTKLLLNDWISREKYMRFFYCEILIVVFSLRLYSCLANGSADEFQKGEHLYKTKSVKEVLQIGMHNVFVIWYICFFIVKVEPCRVWRSIWCNVLECFVKY